MTTQWFAAVQVLLAGLGLAVAIVWFRRARRLSISGHGWTEIATMSKPFVAYSIVILLLWGLVELARHSWS